MDVGPGGFVQATFSRGLSKGCISDKGTGFHQPRQKQYTMADPAVSTRWKWKPPVTPHWHQV